MSFGDGQNEPHSGHSAPRMPNSFSRKSSSPGLGFNSLRHLSQKSIFAS
jgi:hypothetical protein